MLKTIKTVAFDADDTLWENENHFQEAQKQFCRLVSPWLSSETAEEELFKTEMSNLELFGYGAKGFTLSMIETALRVSENKIPAKAVRQLLNAGKHLLSWPPHLLPHAKEVLMALQGKYRLVLATKGDLWDQQRKLRQSGLQPFFSHVEIMSDKKPQDYVRLMNKLNEKPECFLMVGNSLKSDVLAPMETGAYAIHVPYHVTWKHECIREPNSLHLLKAEDLREVLRFLL